MPWGSGLDLEARLVNLFGLGRALHVPRAALGLMASLRAWREGGGGGVVALSAAVCHDVVAAVLGAGCTPKFVDIDPHDGIVPASEWRRARAEGAAAAIVVHLYGNPSDMKAPLLAFAASSFAPRGLIIEDCAQALGSRGTSGFVGSSGNADIVLLSFGATKQIEVGDAAVLFRDSDLAFATQAVLAEIEPTAADVLAAGRLRFRERFEQARALLRTQGVQAVGAFSGLLADYTPLLHVPYFAGGRDICSALDAYDAEILARTRKMELWRRALSGSRLIPVGMNEGTVPWRYACRIEGIDWAKQHALGEKMRARSVNVSHWYLPAHWLCGERAGSLPGVEQLAREVFQFWVDTHTSDAAISEGAQSVRHVVESTYWPR
jgi:dTDP-4-amino-4,6-dideoxygalactose transaminase